MKKFLVLTFFVLLTTMSMTFVRADLISDYGVNINDSNPFKDSNNLYQLFNRYFADQLGSDLYTSSNDLFNDRGVNPYTDWTTNGSQLVGAFKVAALGHTMSMIDSSSGSVVASIMSVGGTTNIFSPNGITDLSGQSVVDIADGLHVNFQLDAYNGSKLMYSWSSDPDENAVRPSTKGDGMIHMIALDITDLYNEKYGTSNDSVYMFGWEDLHQTAAGGGYPADWDYQDFVAIMTNLKPNNNPAATPEPATVVMFLVGGGFGSVVAWRKRKQGKR